MLLVWLFALATGVVNACVLQPEARSGNASQTQQGHDSTSAHPNEPAPSPPCAKFCDEPATAGQVLAQQTDAFVALGLPPAPGHGVRLDATAQPASGVRAELAPRPAAIPIPIAFLRLAL